MVEVKVERGKRTMDYRNSFSDEDTTINFMTSKYNKLTVLPGPKTLERVAGISDKKKQNILKNLGGIIEENRLQFWMDLPTF